MPETMNLTINGYSVSIQFSQETNPGLAKNVRNTLLDAYIRQNNAQIFVGNSN